MISTSKVSSKSSSIPDVDIRHLISPNRKNVGPQIFFLGINGKNLGLEYIFQYKHFSPHSESKNIVL